MNDETTAAVAAAFPGEHQVRTVPRADGIEQLRTIWRLIEEAKSVTPKDTAEPEWSSLNYAATWIESAAKKRRARLAGEPTP